MKVILAFNELYRDGMGTAATTLFRALKAQGVEVQPVHAWRDVKFPEYEEEAKPVFVENDGYGFDGDKIRKMVECVNGLTVDGDVLINFGSANWLACVPYFRKGLRIITAVHSINPSTLKLGRAYAERISAWVCISKGVMDRFLKKLPRKYHGKVHLICNAVDDCPAPKTDYSIDGTLKILFLGRIEDTSKGCGKIPKILAELRRRGIRARCDFYGYFHNWERQFWAAVDKAGVRDMVKYCGEVSHSQVYGIMTQYDIFLTPSNFEGFSLSNSEAMMCALPCVASKIEGVIDWIFDGGKAGLCVPKTDIKAFADAIERLADRAFAAEIGRAGRARIQSLASFEAHGKGYAGLVRAVSGVENYLPVAPHCPIDDYVLPEFLKPWSLARLLPTWLKTWLRRFM